MEKVNIETIRERERNQDKANIGKINLEIIRERLAQRHYVKGQHLAQSKYGKGQFRENT